MKVIQPGERVPDRRPVRVLNKGYVELRWKREGLRVLEHRVFDGIVTTAEVVHHINHDRSDNRRENLRPMTRAEHDALHANDRKQHGTPLPHRKHDYDLIRRLRSQGLTWADIRAATGAPAPVISRALRGH